MKKEAILWYQDRFRRILRNLQFKECNWRKVYDENRANAQNLFTALLSEDVKNIRRRKPADAVKASKPTKNVSIAKAATSSNSTKKKPNVQQKKKASKNEIVPEMRETVPKNVSIIHPESNSSKSVDKKFSDAPESDIRELQEFNSLPMMGDDHDFMLFDDADFGLGMETDDGANSINLDATAWLSTTIESVPSSTTRDSEMFRTDQWLKAQSEINEERKRQLELDRITNQQREALAQMRSTEPQFSETKNDMKSNEASDQEAKKKLQEARERERRKREEQEQTVDFEHQDLREE
jgi:hypothetical protein